MGETEYNATVKVFALYGALFNEIVKDLGEGKALTFHKNAHEYMGLKTGNMLKKQIENDVNLETLTQVLRKGNQSIGIDCQMIEKDDSLLLRNLRCPMYDGYRDGGLSDRMAELLCQVGAPAKLWTTLKVLNPNVVYNLNHYRNKPEERCEEEIKLTYNT